MVNEKLVVEKYLSNSSGGSEDNPETFLNNLRTSSKTNEGAQIIKNDLDSMSAKLFGQIQPNSEPPNFRRRIA